MRIGVPMAADLKSLSRGLAAPAPLVLHVPDQRATKARLFDERAGEVCSGEIGSFEIRPGQIGAAKGRSRESARGKVTPDEPSIVEFGAVQYRVDQAGVGQIGFGKAHLFASHSCQTGRG